MCLYDPSEGPNIMYEKPWKLKKYVRFVPGAAFCSLLTPL